MLNTPVTEAEARRSFAFSQGQGRNTGHANTVQLLTPETHPDLWAAMNLGDEAPAQLWAQGDVSVLTSGPQSRSPDPASFAATARKPPCSSRRDWRARTVS